MAHATELVAAVRLTVPEAHPAFEGHFRGDPVLPGVALVDLVLSELRRALGSELWLHAIPALRFRAPVRPGDALVIRLSKLAAPGHVGFEVRSGEALVSQGTLVARAPA